MGYLIGDQGGTVKLIQFELDTAALQLNTYALPIKPSKCFFFGGYVILSGGTIPLVYGSFSVFGDNSNFGFLRGSGAPTGQDFLIKLRIFQDGVFTPQNPETYSLSWAYIAGDGRAKVVIPYIEYS